MRKGMLVGGTWIFDDVKVVDTYPAEQSLSNILDCYTSNGGSAYNILVDLAKLEAPFPLEGVGLVGDDANGAHIIDHCRVMGIDSRQLRITNAVPTSYTIVTSVKKTGRRTFFHNRGANSLLDCEHFDFGISNAKIFHLGYLLLLDRLDKIQRSGRTGASYLLERAKSEGFITSIDLVSEDSDRFTTIIPVTLPHVDYLFLNEYEASRLSSIDLLDLDRAEMADKCNEVFERIFAMGVNEWCIIHSPDGVWAARRDGQRLFQPSLQLPDGWIVGTNGAGDALAAGVLFGIHEGWDMDVNLKLGVCTAVASLSHITCSEGVRSYKECLDLSNKFHKRE